MDVPAGWQAADGRIVSQAASGCVALAAGLPDRGKSTFCAFLASQLHQAGYRTAVVDADVGQSSIGSPTAISGGFLLRPIRQLDAIEPAAGYFVGSISPVGHRGPALQIAGPLASTPGVLLIPRAPSAVKAHIS